MTEKPQTNSLDIKQNKELNPLFVKQDHILIVDDDPLILAVLENTLQRDGYRVLTAKNGQEAIEQVNKHPIAVIICDINLPDMNGIDVCKKVKSVHNEIERLLITGMSNLKDLEKDFSQEEITQVITKPWEELVLRQTVRIAWKKNQEFKEHALLKEWIESLQEPPSTVPGYTPKHLLFGKKVQEHVLMAKNDPAASGLEISTLFLPLENAYTDFFEYYYPSSDQFDVVIGHVLEKGISAALMGTMLKSEISHHEEPVIKHEVYEKRKGWTENLIPLEGLFEYLENKVGAQFYNLNILSAVTIARFNLPARVLSLVNCGNPRGLFLKASSKKVVQLKDQQYPCLGMQKHGRWMTLDISYDPGDLFVFYSAGFPPSGEKVLLELIKERPDIKPDDLVTEMKQFLKSLDAISDVTMTVLRMNQKDPSLSNRFLSATFKSSTDELESVRNFILQLCRNVPGDKEKLIFHLQLVINEIFCNIVEHGYSKDPKGLIIIKGVQGSEGISLDFFDQGNSYTPSEIPEPILTGDAERGFGLYIVKELVAQIIYTPKASKSGWNHLHVLKNFCLGDSNMNMTHNLANDVLIITPDVVNLDAKYAAEFKEKVIQLITENEATYVVLDLNNVQFIDSSGLGSFLSILRLLHAQGGELKLARVHRPIKTMFELVAMNKIFDIHDQTDDAIAAFNNE